MTTSNDGLALIKEFEGCRLKSYKCPAGIWTIGYGHTRGVKRGMTITKEIAERLLIEDIQPVEKDLNAFNDTLNIKLRQAQFDALVSFVFNLGIGRFNSSTLRRKIVNGASDADIAKEFKRWVFSGNRVLPGLVKRRAKEAATWML